MIESLFESISEQMLKEFDISAWINHNGVKGSLREDALHNFLVDGRLPEKYGIASGIVVTTLNTDQSNQLDLIIYDKNLCPAWIKSRSCQVLPIEGIYGCIEVKSKLSKDELQDSLKKIKSLRALTPERCSFPFGIVFAYSLSDNSLNSLEKNLQEFQANRSPLEWPNLVVVLNEGIIFQKRGLETVFETEKFDRNTRPVAFQFGKDSLFQFYSFLFDSLNLRNLSPFLASRYANQPIRLKELTIRHYGYTNSNDYEFLKSLFYYCQNIEKITLEQVFDMPFLGNRQDIDLKQEVYFYDPEKLPSDIRNLIDQITNQKDLEISASVCRFPLGNVEINYENYYFPMYYLSKFRSQA